ncbi:MAG: NAD(P)/FAD-dependent oxidoreductase [Acidobacteriota bacterium]|nr:NAD(P)/FAD-dependent oxidoreductase [Acidobacteriota bacterium]
MQTESSPRVVIVGGGFGGLYAAQALRNAPVAVTLIDRKNHHSFQPLLYQVATAGLSPGDIAKPIREILRHQKNAEVLMAAVTGFDLARKQVTLTGGEHPYDYLIIAAGARHSYFGHDDWEKFAPGLKTLEDALEMRRRILTAFEKAELEADVAGAQGPLNFVIIGAGPTGVELAGALAEVAGKSLARDFRRIDPSKARILLLEGGPHVLPSYPEDLSRSAEEQLRALGVEVRTGAQVTRVEADAVFIGKDEERLPAAVVLWAAGVQASPLGKLLGVPTDHCGRVVVGPDLSLPGHPDVFVIGDLASIKRADGHPVPGVAPAAIQMGRWTAKNIIRDLEHKPRRDFEYVDKGSLATIGRAAAVAEFGKVHISGIVAWVAWLVIHLFSLIGFRNRAMVMTEWAWSYVTFQKAARLITDPK